MLNYIRVRTMHSCPFLPLSSSYDRFFGWGQVDRIFSKFPLAVVFDSGFWISKCASQVFLSDGVRPRFPIRCCVASRLRLRQIRATFKMALPELHSCDGRWIMDESFLWPPLAPYGPIWLQWINVSSMSAVAERLRVRNLEQSGTLRHFEAHWGTKKYWH